MPVMADNTKRAYWTAKRIKELRDRLDLTQEEAAAKVGVTRRQWAAWEGKESKPSGPSVKLLALLDDGTI